MFDDAVTLYLNGYLDGQEALLMATSNETAARLAGLVRERLAELGKVGEAEITLADGNQAGRGDLIRARLNTRIDADGQTLANRDVVRVESINDSGFGRLAAVRRQTGPDQWSRPFFVPVAYLESDAELAYAGNVHVAQGRTVDRGHLVVDSGADPQPGLHRRDPGPGEEHHPRGDRAAGPGAADPGRAGGLRRGADPPGAPRCAQGGTARPGAGGPAADAGPAQRPAAGPVGGGARPGAAAGRAGADRARGDPGGAGLHDPHRAPVPAAEAFWRLDVVPQIDEMVRQRITPARVRAVPEGPGAARVPAGAAGSTRSAAAAIEDVLDSITAEPLTGLRSIAAGLHGRAGKEPAPARGQTTTVG